MSAELTAALGSLALLALSLLGVVLRAWGDRILAELKANTTETRKAKVAAEKVADQVDWQQRATALQLENDQLRRTLGLLEGLPDCQDCRLKIAALLHASPVLRRRTDPTPTQEPRP